MKLERKPSRPTNPTTAAALKLDRAGYDCCRINPVFWRVTFPNGRGTVLNNGELKQLAKEV
jgi:hypothetical protein